MKDRGDGSGASGEVPQEHNGPTERPDDPTDVPGEGPQETLEEAEARLREFGVMHDSMASFAGPDDEHGNAQAGGTRRGRRRRQPPDQTSDLGYGYDYDDPGGASVWRWVVRIVAPLAFVGMVVAAILVVVNSGVLDAGEAAISPSPTVSPSEPAKAETRTYKVKKNDTLSQIAQRFGTTVDKILEANPKVNISNLRVGQKLKIPATE